MQTSGGKALKITAALAAIGLASAASPALAGDAQGWAMLNVDANLGDGFKASAQTVARTSDAKGFYEFQQHVMVGYKVDPAYTVWLGYTLAPYHDHGRLTNTEHRFRQQVSFDNIAKIGPVKVTGRVRSELRWRDGFSGTAWRVRPYIKAAVPLAGKTNLNLSHESFINIETTAFQKQAGYDRMRNAVSISTPLAKHLSVEVGYLNQHGFVRRGADTVDHAATVALSVSF